MIGHLPKYEIENLSVEDLRLLSRHLANQKKAVDAKIKDLSGPFIPSEDTQKLDQLRAEYEQMANAAANSLFFSRRKVEKYSKAAEAARQSFWECAIKEFPHLKNKQLTYHSDSKEIIIGRISDVS